MFEKVCDAFAEILRIPAEEISPESRILEDLKADSIDVLQLLMLLEEREGVVIPDEKLAAFRKVQDIVDYMESL